MPNPYAQSLVGDLVMQQPGRSEVFERSEIDYCCQGRRTLAEACFDQRLDLDRICNALSASDEQATARPEPDWSRLPLAELTEHLVGAHHRRIRRALPRLCELATKVFDRTRTRRLKDLEQLLAVLEAELLRHLYKEEAVLFPRIKELDQPPAAISELPTEIAQPIRMMEREHQWIVEVLRRIRWLADDYHAPRNSSRPYRLLVAGLANLERDLHWVIHKENYVLFPRAIERVTRKEVSDVPDVRSLRSVL